MEKINSFGVVAFKKSVRISNVLVRILEWSNKNNVKVYFHPVLEEQADTDAPVCSSEEEFLACSEAVISLGGDGTFLSVANI
ncbi:MAG: hypothetical protein Q4F84_06450 [Fibrobacter sp.]|nr:hypothetical protein [Fibrobacter sp.]